MICTLEIIRYRKETINIHLQMSIIRQDSDIQNRTHIERNKYTLFNSTLSSPEKILHPTGGGLVSYRRKIRLRLREGKWRIRGHVHQRP